jgi:hypothetical protein
VEQSGDHRYYQDRCRKAEETLQEPGGSPCEPAECPVRGRLTKLLCFAMVARSGASSRGPKASRTSSLPQRQSQVLGVEVRGLRNRTKALAELLAGEL